MIYLIYIIYMIYNKQSYIYIYHTGQQGWRGSEITRKLSSSWEKVIVNQELVKIFAGLT